MAAPDRIDPSKGPIQPLQPTAPGKTDGPGRTTEGKTFEEVLRNKVRGTITTDRPQSAPATEEPASTITWSAHAAARLRQRGIELTDAQHARLETAFSKAENKGAKDALMMLDDTAMVVSVKNRTVITALGMHQARENVFTNIDSAVIA